MSAYMPKSKTDNWASPKHIVQQVVEEFGIIDLDPAASKSNSVCKRFFDESMDGLKQGWVADLVYTNPPYGRILNEWVKKALNEYDLGHAQRIVMLLPSRTCTRWFHALYERPDVEIRFIKGRLKYGDGKQAAPFPSMLVIIGRNQDHLSTALEIMTDRQIDQYLEAIADDLCSQENCSCSEENCPFNKVGLEPEGDDQ